MAKTATKKAAKKKPVKLSQLAERFLVVINHMLSQGLYKNEAQLQAVVKYGQTNIWKLKNGKQDPTIHHAKSLCEISGASMDYLCGFSDTMMRKPAKDPIEMLDQAVMTIKEAYGASPAARHAIIRKQEKS